MARVAGRRRKNTVKEEQPELLEPDARKKSLLGHPARRTIRRQCKMIPPRAPIRDRWGRVVE
jgi:hypothetical protein